MAYGITFTTDTSATLSMNIATIKVSMDTAATIQPIPQAHPLIIRLGYTGNTIQFTGKIFTETDYGVVDALTGETILTVTTSNYPEFPAGSSWLVSKREVSRKGGYLNQWDVSMTVITTLGGLT